MLNTYPYNPLMYKIIDKDVNPDLLKSKQSLESIQKLAKLNNKIRLSLKKTKQETLKNMFVTNIDIPDTWTRKRDYKKNIYDIFKDNSLEEYMRTAYEDEKTAELNINKKNVLYKQDNTKKTKESLHLLKKQFKEISNNKSYLFSNNLPKHIQYNLNNYNLKRNCLYKAPFLVESNNSNRNPKLNYSKNAGFLNIIKSKHAKQFYNVNENKFENANKLLENLKNEEFKNNKLKNILKSSDESKLISIDEDINEDYYINNEFIKKSKNKKLHKLSQNYETLIKLTELNKKSSTAYYDIDDKNQSSVSCLNNTNTYSKVNKSYIKDKKLIYNKKKEFNSEELINNKKSVLAKRSTIANKDIKFKTKDLSKNSSLYASPINSNKLFNSNKTNKFLTNELNNFNLDNKLVYNNSLYNKDNYYIRKNIRISTLNNQDNIKLISDSKEAKQATSNLSIKSLNLLNQINKSQCTLKNNFNNNSKFTDCIVYSKDKHVLTDSNSNFNIAKNCNDISIINKTNNDLESPAKSIRSSKNYDFMTSSIKKEVNINNNINNNILYKRSNFFNKSSAFCLKDNISNSNKNNLSNYNEKIKKEKLINDINKNIKRNLNSNLNNSNMLYNLSNELQLKTDIYNIKEKLAISKASTFNKIFKLSKYPKITDSKVKELVYDLKEYTSYGPYLSNCNLCNSKNLDFYNNSNKETAINMLNVLKKNSISNI